MVESEHLPVKWGGMRVDIGLLCIYGGKRGWRHFLCQVHMEQQIRRIHQRTKRFFHHFLVNLSLPCVNGKMEALKAKGTSHKTQRNIATYASAVRHSNARQ